MTTVFRAPEADAPPAGAPSARAAAAPTGPLHLVRVPLMPRALLEFARHQRLPVDVGDVGYFVHAWVADVFGTETNPLKPFALPRDARAGADGELDVLAYSPHDAATLREMAAERLGRSPSARLACDWLGVTSKPMPTTWAAGRHFGFQVRACPMTRANRDVYSAARDAAVQDATAPPAPASRPEAYRAWLAREVAACGGRVLNSGLTGYRSEMFCRHHHARDTRPSVRLSDATFAGELEVADPIVFGTLLSRGVGNHRSFGFGMVLLRSLRG